jgi:hypothetical protein
MAAIDERARTQRKARFLRPDAWRYRRPQAGRASLPSFMAEDERTEFIADLASIRRNLVALRLCLAAIVARKYDPDQPRIPAGQPGGGQWTDGDGARHATLRTEGNDRRPELLQPVQSVAPANSVQFLKLLQAGGENIGSFGDRISIAKGPGISHEESSDPDTGLTIVSFAGIGSVVIDERDEATVIGRRYEVGTTDRPDLGMSVIIDRNGFVRAYTTFRS